MDDWMVIDTWVLVELMRMGPKATVLRSHADGKRWIVPEIVLAEFSGKLHAYGCKTVASVLESLSRKSDVKGINVAIADRAGQVYLAHKKNGLAMNDAVIWSTTEYYGAKLLTLDNDFKPFKNAIVL